MCKESICWKSVEYNFDVAVVTTANFKSCYTLIINAVINCTVLLDKWADKSTQKMVIYCFIYLYVVALDILGCTLSLVHIIRSKKES